jgi:hypothetical protein
VIELRNEEAINDQALPESSATLSGRSAACAASPKIAK